MFVGKQFSVHLYHTLKFYVEDNKIKLVFTDFELVNMDGPALTSKMIFKTKIENMDKGLDKRSAKRQEKLTDSNERHARRINRLVTEFLIDTQKKLSSK
jgi:hypothetical protein